MKCREVVMIVYVMRIDYVAIPLLLRMYPDFSLEYLNLTIRVRSLIGEL